MAGTLARQIMQKVAQSDWTGALLLAQSAAQTAEGLELGIALALQANIEWELSTRAVRNSLRLIERALPLLDSSPEWTARALIDGCVMADFAHDEDRHLAWGREIRHMVDENEPSVLAWRGRLLYRLGHYYQGVKGDPVRAANAFRDAISFYKKHVGPHDKHDCECQVRWAWTALGDLHLSRHKHEEALVAFAAARRIRSAEGETSDSGRSAVAYLEGRLAALEGRSRDAITAYERGIALVRQHNREHKLLLSLIEGLVEAHRSAGDRSAVEALVDGMLDEMIDAVVPQVVLRLQQLGAPCGEEVAS